MISHDNLVWTANQAFLDVEGDDKIRIRTGDRLITYLPLSHIAALLNDFMMQITLGC